MHLLTCLWTTSCRSNGIACDAGLKKCVLTSAVSLRMLGQHVLYMPAETKHMHAGIMCHGQQFLNVEEAVYLVDRGSLLLVQRHANGIDVSLSRQETYNLLV